MASERIWNPDIVLFNNADGRYEVSYKARALLYSEGESLSQVFFLPPSIFKSYCKIDVKYFPFGISNCVPVYLFSIFFSYYYRSTGV